MPDLLTADHFMPHVGKTFRPQGTHHAFTLTHIEQRRLEDWENKELGLRQPFNLIFRGPPD